MYILLKQRLGNNGCEVRHRSKKKMKKQTSARGNFISNPSRWLKAILSLVPCVDRYKKDTPYCLVSTSTLLVQPFVFKSSTLLISFKEAQHACVLCSSMLSVYACLLCSVFCFLQCRDRFNGRQE